MIFFLKGIKQYWFCISKNKKIQGSIRKFLKNFRNLIKTIRTESQRCCICNIKKITKISNFFIFFFQKKKSYNNIAIVYQEQNNFEEALKNHEKALEIRLKNWGIKHPEVAQVLLICLL